jgi:hypothetical protein
MAKDKATSSSNISEIDPNVTDPTGKRVFYQLAPGEGDTSVMEGKTKVPAIVSHRYTDGRRDGQGRLLTHLCVLAPGGVFFKDAPQDSGRDPGTWDVYQPGDLGS